MWVEIEIEVVIIDKIEIEVVIIDKIAVIDKEWVV